MKKNLFWLVLTLLFVVSCSNGDEPLIPCITVSDCPDSSYSCFDGFCVHAGAVVDPVGSDSDSSSGETLPDGGQNEGGNTNDNDSENDSDLPEPATVDNDENSEPSSDKDSAEISDKDNGETSDKDEESSDEDGTQTSDGDAVEENDSETTDNGGNENADKENISDADNEEENDAETSDENTTGNDADNENNDGEGGDDFDNEGGSDGDSGSVSDEDTESGDLDNDIDADVDNDADHDVELPTEPAACAAAIAALPHGGKYDWDDDTTQGFSTNNYWNLVESSVLAARSGSYSFGKYSQYTVNKDQVSPLSTATDLSQCAQCTVKASFYVKGKICNGNCEAQTFLHPVCNGEGNTDVIDKTETTWSQWTMPPSSPWVCDEWNDFKAKANNNQYSAVAWKDLEWTIPAACKTNQFVFGLRFRSSSGVPGPGLVVDDLTIYATTKNEPKGEFESAEDGKITGWACDPDAYSEKVPVKVRYYKNNDESVIAAERSVDAESERTDLTQCNGMYNHGFEIPLDAELATILGIGTHSAAVFIGDLPVNCSGTYKLIGTKEFEITGLGPKQQ